MMLFALISVLAQQSYYSPANTTSFTSSTTTITYRDAARQERVVHVALRVPALGGALPVVIWSHGGGPLADANQALPIWSDTTARAGYLTVTVAHGERAAASKTALCAAFELTAELCALFDPLIWDRPNDLRQVMNALERLNGAGELRNRIDLRRIAVAGHGEGSSAALSLVGARRTFEPLPPERAPSFEDERAVLALALSPMAGGLDGFFDNEVGGS